MKGPRLIAFGEVLEEIRAQAIRTRWGHWHFYKNLTLECRDARGFLYEIDLDRCRTSAELLDWVFQVHLKTWSTPQIMAELLDALHDLLDPQASLCSFGENKQINPRAVLKARARGWR